VGGASGKFNIKVIIIGYPILYLPPKQGIYGLFFGDTSEGLKRVGNVGRR